ncbi:MAG: hypothetical protein H6606_05785 [Flavobacteriales bacterium]|nr:hypothetical protein [Flavobacteriales bacterium]
MKRKLLFAIPLLLFTILNGLWLGSGLPQGVHVWAQSDRYAIAVNFMEVPDILDPRTHNLATEDGKVGVEFPGIQYLSACIARSINRASLPFIYRWLTALLFSSGLIAFLITVKLPTPLKAALAILLISPIGLYYQFNFLPDSASIGLLLFAFAAFNKFRENLKYTHLIHLVILSGLAALLKTSGGVYFLSFSAIPLFWPQRSQFTIGQRLVVLLLSLAVLSGIVWYDHFYFMEKNRRLWSVVFMSASNPIGSLEEFVVVWKNMRTWRLEYLSVYQYAALLVLSILLMKLNHKKIKWGGTSKWFALNFLGVLLFFILIGQQFSNHDYYFICTFYPLFIWGFTELLRVHYQEGTLHYTALFSPILFIAILHGIQISTQAHQRKQEIYTAGTRQILNETIWMREAKLKLEELNIDKHDIFFVLYEFGPNTPLVLIDRKGLVFNHEEMSRKDSSLHYWFERLDPPYALIRKKWLPDFRTDHPDLLENSELVYDNDSFILLKLPTHYGS